MRLLVLLLLTLPALVAADDATLTWSVPTEYENGKPLPLSDLRESVAEWIECNGLWPTVGTPASAVVPSPGALLVVPGLNVGTWCFRVAVVTTLGAQSDWSNVATKTIEPPKPRPPTIIQIDIQTTATLEQTSDGGLRLVVR